MKDILGLIAASPGWLAGMRDSSLLQGYRVIPVAAWAHVSLPSGDVGMIAVVRSLHPAQRSSEEMILATELPDFVGILEPGEKPDIWFAKQDFLLHGPEYAAPRARRLLTGPNGLGGRARPR